MRDELDAAITDAIEDGHLEEDASGRHLSEEHLIGQLHQTLSHAERATAVAHLARCPLCCDRLEAAADVLEVDVLGRGFDAASATSLDIGAPLMSVSAQLGDGRLHVGWSDAEVQIGREARLRRGRDPGAGISFVRRFADGSLRVELISSRGEEVGVGVTLEGAPSDCRASVIVGGRLVMTEPLREGQAWLRGVPLRLCQVCLETSRGVLGHVRLDLSALRDGGEA